MRKVKHWLHILLTILTSGLWLPVYVILLATTEMFNRGYREGKAAGRVARQNEIDEERARPKFEWAQAPDARTFNCRSVAPPIADFAPSGEVTDGVINARTQSRVDRFAELADRVRTVGLDQYERAEFNQLRQELSR